MIGLGAFTHMLLTSQQLLGVSCKGMPEFHTMAMPEKAEKPYNGLDSRPVQLYSMKMRPIASTLTYAGAGYGAGQLYIPAMTLQ